MENEKPKIKLSELTDIYDIEDDHVEKITQDVEKVKKDTMSFEDTIEEGDKALEESFDDGSW